MSNKDNRGVHNDPQDKDTYTSDAPEKSDDFAAQEAEKADNAAEDGDAEAGVADAVNEAAAENDVDTLKTELENQKKEYLFLMAEFDNFRKRTLREKSEIIRNAGENVLKGLLPIVDDFERGLKAVGVDAPAVADGESGNENAEGFRLIYNKLCKYLEQNGVKAFDPEDRDFDADRHEAISVVPVPDEKMKGKILDTIEKGYMINDKVLRHAKVVVGQ